MKKILGSLLLLLILHPVFSQDSSSLMDRRLVQYFQSQQYEKAVRYLQLMINPDTADSRYLSLLGYSYYMSNQLGEASGCFERLLKSDSANSGALYYLGTINASKGNYPSAIKYFCRLVETKPGQANYYKKLAELFQKTGNEAASGWYYKLSYQINPNDPEVTAGLAINWINQELYQKADSILDRALQKDSLQARLLILRIRSAYEQEDYSLVFPLANKLKAMHFFSQKPFLMTAISYFNIKNYDSCIATCNYLILNKSGTQTVLYLKALSYKALKQYKNALSSLNACIHMALDEAADNYFSTKGEVFILMHQPSRALKQYDTAYYIFRKPVQLYNKARIYDGQFENYKAALRYYRRYLKHQKAPKSGNEKEITAFVKKRVKQLEEWEVKQ